MQNSVDNLTRESLAATATYIVHPPRGILAADESPKTCCKRFADHSLECTDDSRRAFREMIITAPGLENYLSGIILTDETIRQATADGKLFTHVLIEKGIKPGIKVDEGINGYKNEDDIEFVTKGLEGLPARMKEYREMGAAFAKWRSVFPVTVGLPTGDALAENVRRMRDYALICQANNIVPIVEPEVLMDGSHPAADAEDTLRKVLTALFAGLRDSDVHLPGLILKTSMAVSGKNADVRAQPDAVAERTLSVLGETVPEDIGGVVFLSGGQTHDEANANYDAIMRRAQEVPFKMTYSFSRAFQNEALKHYAANPTDNWTGAQRILVESIKNIAEI